MSNGEYVTAFAPASIGNVGVGFDILGLAIAGAGDRVSVRKTAAAGIRIEEIFGLDGESHAYLSRDAEHNTASLAAKALWDDKGDASGIELIIRKGVPLQSGMGSSAASAVAAAVAVNELLDEPLPTLALLPYALEGEKYASGALHADNVAPSLLGGLVYCPKALLPDAYRLPTPEGISSVLVHPEMQLNTAKQRKILARSYSLELWREQQSYLAGFIAGCQQNNPDLIRRCLKDVIIEPQRKGAVPCFDAVKEAAMKANALGCSLSGSGPGIFALCLDADAQNAATVMVAACRNAGYECHSWVSPMTAAGANVEEQE